MKAKQNVTEADLLHGRIRCGVKLKPAFPQLKCQVEIIVVGTSLLARYDPRNGPDRNRSGVLQIGRGQLRSLINEPRALTFRLANGVPEFS